jgi:hypothetical protein
MCLGLAKAHRQWLQLQGWQWKAVAAELARNGVSWSYFVVLLFR